MSWPKSSKTLEYDRALRWPSQPPDPGKHKNNSFFADTELKLSVTLAETNSQPIH